MPAIFGLHPDVDKVDMWVAQAPAEFLVKKALSKTHNCLSHQFLEAKSNIP